MIYDGSDQIWSSLDHNKMSDSSAAPYKSSVKFHYNIPGSRLTEIFRLNEYFRRKHYEMGIYKFEILITVFRATLLLDFRAVDYKVRFRHRLTMGFKSIQKGPNEPTTVRWKATAKLVWNSGVPRLPNLEHLFLLSVLVITGRQGFGENAQMTTQQ